jgi:hypothetical protein
MEILIKRFGMKKLIFLILCFSLSEAKDFSSRDYNSIDEQQVYNVIKKIFASSNQKNITDTNWSTLHISQRSTTGYINIDVLIKNILLTTHYNSDNETKNISLEIFSTVNDENTFLPSEHILHSIIWNRIEYALGLEDNWMTCTNSFNDISHINNSLCTIDKNALRISK